MRSLATRPILAAAALAVGGLTAACGDAGPELKVLVLRDPGALEAALESFRTEHRSVQVRVERVGAEELADRLRVDGVSADVIWGLDPIELVRMPGGPPAERAYVVYAAAPFVFAFNREHTARSRMPRDWADLFHVRWMDEVAIPDPGSYSPSALLLGWWITAEEARTGDPEAGFDWLRRLDVAVEVYPPTAREALLLLRSGTASIAVLPRSAVEAAMEEFDWLAYTLPESGSPLWRRLAVVREGPDTTGLARKFLATLAGEGVGGEGVVEADSPAPLDATRIGRDLDRWLERWRTEIRGATDVVG